MRAPPLGELYDLLRAEGFPIGVDDHVRVNRLLALDAAWTLDDLRTAICALVVKDRRDRPAFDACWARWASAQPEVHAAPPPLPRIAAPAPSRRLVAWSLAGCAALAAAAFALVHGTERTAAPPDAAIAIDAPPADAPVLADTAVDVAVDAAPLVRDAARPVAVAPGRAEPAIADAGVRGDAAAPAAPTDAATVDAEAVEPPVVAPAPAPAPGSGSEAWLTVLAIAFGAALSLAAGAFAIRLAARRRSFVPGPWSYRVAYPRPRHAALGRAAVEDAAADLTWQSEAAGTRLDIARSVERTVARGIPELVYARPPAAPEYVVLEDVAGGSERWRFLFDELVRGLAREGVRLARYTFAALPDRVQSGDGRVHDLGVLVEHCDALVVIGDGAAGIDPVTDRPADWIAVLRQVPRRVWINPLPPSRWTAGARAIARDTPMEHGVAGALAAFRPGGGAAQAIRPFPAVIERAPGTASAALALRSYLGDDAFALACAVAVAGPPSVASARWLAERFEHALDEAAWLRVVTLPWMVSGVWPAGLRDRLVAAAAPGVVERVAADAERLLVHSEPPVGSAAHLVWELDLAARRVARGDVRGAELAVARVAATPLEHEARNRREALGFRDRRGRAVKAAVALGLALVVLGLDPLGPHQPVQQTPARSGELVETNRSSFRVAVDDVTVTALAGTRGRFTIAVRAFDTLTGRLLALAGSPWRVSFGDWTSPLAIQVADDTRPITELVVMQSALADSALAEVREHLAKLPATAHFGVLEYGQSVRVHPFDTIPKASGLGDTGLRPTLRGALDRAIHILANARSSRRHLVVISDGTEDERGPTMAQLGAAARAAGIMVDAVGFSVEDRRRPLYKLGDLARASGGTFAWARNRIGVGPELARARERIASSVVLVGERDLEELTAFVVWATLADGTAIVSPAVRIPPVEHGSASASARPPARTILRLACAAVAVAALIELLFGWAYSIRRRALRSRSPGA